MWNQFPIRAYNGAEMQARDCIEGRDYIMQDDSQDIAKVWVMTIEAAEITGYTLQYMTKLSQRLAKLPEHERKIKIRKLANRYQMWLPDLMAHMKERGPYKKQE